MHGSLALLVSVEVKNLSVQLKREVRACIFVEQISSSASERLCFSLRCATVIFACLFFFFFFFQNGIISLFLIFRSEVKTTRLLCTHWFFLLLSFIQRGKLLIP